MTQVIMTNRAVSHLSRAGDPTSILLKMMAAGAITQYYIVQGEEVIAAIDRVPPEEPLVVVVADSGAVAALEKEMLGRRLPNNTDIIRVRPEGSLQASVALTAMQGGIVAPSDFWQFLEGVIKKYSSAPRVEKPDTRQEAGEQPTEVGEQPPEKREPVEQAPPPAGGVESPQPAGFFARLFRGRQERPRQVVAEDKEQEREQESEVGAVVKRKGEEEKREKDESDQSPVKTEKVDARAARLERVVVVKCSRVGISGATADEFGRISRLVDKIYSGAVRVTRVPLSTVGVTTFPVIAIVNGRNIDDPQLARASLVVIMEEDTQPAQLSSLPEVDTIVTGRKKIVDVVMGAVRDFVEGKRCAL